ncbi:hypothetical protein NDA18_001197 [Ustilago nuda]|nr:hypothetical protein NDA18_001197 [Ustilago nuda]
MEHLEGTYNTSHPRWSRTFDDALTNATQGTIDTTGEYNINYNLLDIIKEYLTFHEVWKKIENGLGGKATRNSCHLALITQLGDIKMFNSNAQKLIQENRTIQAESSILGKPFADDTLFSTLQKCMIQHPVYKDTVTTVHHLNFDALAVALSMCQLAIESAPAQKWDSWQANARFASNTEKGNLAKEADANNTRSKSCKIRFYICKCIEHGAKQCNASVSIPENSPFTKTD